MTKTKKPSVEGFFLGYFACAGGTGGASLFTVSISGANSMKTA